MATPPRRFVTWASGFVLATTASVARAADPDLAFAEAVLSPESGDHLYFGIGVQGGDYDADGFSDVAVGQPGPGLSPSGKVFVYGGGSTGLDPAPIATLVALEAEIPAGYGRALQTLDANGDGYDDLVVSAYLAGRAYWYPGGPGGLRSEAARLLEPTTASLGSTMFGSVMFAPGDLNGDGYAELAIGDNAWTLTPDAGTGGAIFVYAGSAAGLESCEDELLTTEDGAGQGSSLGAYLGGGQDFDGDGYSELLGGCYWCSSGHGDGTLGTLFVWNGGPTGVAPHDPVALPVCCAPDAVPDLDGDGRDDLVVREPYPSYRAYVYYGAPGLPGGVDIDHPYLLSDLMSDVASAGDVDGDGLGDILVGMKGSQGRVGIIFGDPARAEAPDWLLLKEGSGIDEGWAKEYSLNAIGDVQGDGRPELAVPAGNAGTVSVFAPVCTWYADSDADGHGDPAVAVSSCHDQPGRAPYPDDCDDGDPSVHGQLWYTDSDGDGFGTGAGTLACGQPAATSSSHLDCDDGDPTINPGVPDVTADGIDRDCDGHDGPWAVDTDGCDGDTADSADPGDSADPYDSADEGGDDSGPKPLTGPGCGCAAGDGGSSAGGLAATAVLASAARRRFRGQVPRPRGRHEEHHPCGTTVPGAAARDARQ
ncbi:hypothetical protein LBMAG42_43480 [Deltaproteobacteria bacterium]|nr:hypothetical protein LBMAG42_43480 [Deltaproteobacteria bacterium]